MVLGIAIKLFKAQRLFYDKVFHSRDRLHHKPIIPSKATL